MILRSSSLFLTLRVSPSPFSLFFIRNVGSKPSVGHAPKILALLPKAPSAFSDTLPVTPPSPFKMQGPNIVPTKQPLDPLPSIDKGIKKENQPMHTMKKSDFESVVERCPIVSGPPSPIPSQIPITDQPRKKLESSVNPLKSTTKFLKNTFQHNNNESSTPIPSTPSKTEVPVTQPLQSDSSFSDSLDTLQIPAILPPSSPVIQKPPFSPAMVQEITPKISDLEKRKLKKIAEEILTKDFYKYAPILHQKDEKEIVKVLETDSNNFHIGLLKIQNEKDSVFPSGLQSHAVIVYTLQKDKMIVWAYLTSEQDKSNKKLSDTQYHLNKDPKAINKPQMMKEIPPMIITAKDLEALKGDNNPQQYAEAYIKKEEISRQLQYYFDTVIKPQLSKPLPVYNGIGVSLENINETLENHNKTSEQKAHKYLSDYKTRINQKYTEKEINRWLKGIKSTDIITHEKLLSLIENERNKYN